MRHHLSREARWSPPSHLTPAPRGSGVRVQQPGLPLDPDPVNACLPAPRAPHCPQACGPGVLRVLSVSPSPLPCVSSPGLGPFSLSWEPPGQEQYPAKRPASSTDAAEVRGSWAPRGLLGPPLWSRGSWALPCGSGTPGGASGGRHGLPPGHCSCPLQAHLASCGGESHAAKASRPGREMWSSGRGTPGVKQKHLLSAEIRTPAFSITAARGGAGPSLTRGDSCSSQAPPISASRARGHPLWSLMSPSCIPPTPHR